MNARKYLPILAAVALLVACGEQTRNGQLTLSGSKPVAIRDEGGAVVNFGNGPLKVKFGADGSRKVTVELEQGSSKAKFSGQVPNVSDWNVTIPGGSIGQSVDLTSQRSVALTGPIWTSIGSGGFCGFNGTWQTEERWQQGDESWSVIFTDAGTGQKLGVFASRHTDPVLLSSRNTWCRERPEPHERFPRGPNGRWGSMAQQLGDIQPASVKFD